MKRFDELENELSSRWGDDPARDVCLKILQYMYDQPNERLTMLTFYSIGRIVGRQPLDNDVLRALAILVSSKVNALDKRTMFIDEEREYEITSSQMDFMKRHNRFVHPNTGELVDGFEDKLVPFFVPSQEFLRLKAQKNG